METQASIEAAENLEGGNQKPKQSKRGRKPLVDLEKQLEAYRTNKLSLLTESKEIKPHTDEIFATIGNQLGMTVKAVHWSVTRNANEIFGEENFIHYEKTKPSNADENIDFLSSDGENMHLTVHIGNRKDQYYFDLIETVGPRRSYLTLRPGWTDALFDIITRETGTNCIINFVRANVRDSEFVATGKCKECEGAVIVTSSNNRQTLSIELQKGLSTHTHTKFRRLTSARSAKIASELQKKTVNEVYLSQATNIPIDSEHFPRNFLSLKSVENVKMKQNKQTESAIDALRLLKYSSDYGESIKELSIEPFGIIFWTKSQRYTYSQIARDHGAVISLDATGGLIISNSLLTDIRSKIDRRVNLPHIFLYLISVKVPNGKSTPVGQMLSSQQDSIKISYFLDRWNQEFCTPREVITDDSAALLKSISKSFGKFASTNDYIKQCFDVLTGTSTEIPKIFMRLDVAHYVKSMHRKKELKKMKPEVRQLYLAVIGFLMQCESFEAMGKIVEHMVILVNVEWIGEIKGQTLPTNESLQALSSLVRSHEIRFIENENIDSENEDVDEEIQTEINDTSEKSTEVKWYDGILNRVMEKVKKIDNSIKDKTKTNLNPYYNPSLNALFRKEMNRIPLWTAVMKPLFKSPNQLATSNDTEAQFNVIKNVVFKEINLPTRPDIFIERMLCIVDNVATLNRLEVKQKNLLQMGSDSKPDDKALNSGLESSMMEMSLEEEEPFENWRGKGNSSTNTHKKYRSTSSILNKQVAEKLQLTKLAILNDGYLNSKRDFPLVENTSGFDVTLYLLFCRMVDDDVFKANVLRRVDSDMNSFMQTYLLKGSHVDTYVARNTVLLKYYLQTNVRRMKVLDCQSSVSNVLESVFVDSLPSVIMKATCNCTSEKNGKAAVLCIDEKDIELISNGAKLDFINTLKAKVCGKCHSLQAIDEKAQLNNLIFIDMQDQFIKFAQIPQVILIEDKIFILYSMVETLKKSAQKTCYVAHIKRSNQAWYTFDNNSKKVTSAKFDGKDKPVHLLCYLTTFSVSEPKSVSSSKPLEVIQNFDSCTVHGMRVNVNNVCGPDSLLHILGTIYKFSPHLFSGKIENDRILSIISDYNRGDTERVYQQRALLVLEKKFTTTVASFNEITVDCESNIYSTLNMLCADNYPSAKITRKCECKIIDRNLGIIEVDMKLLASAGIANLQFCIKNSTSRSACSDCTHNIDVQTEFSNIIFIDTQPMTTQQFSFQLPEMKLIDIPQSIELGAKNYALKGVVEYQPAEGGRSHYSAHCVDNNHFFEFNDLLKTSRRSNTEAFIQPHMLVYVACEV